MTEEPAFRLRRIQQTKAGRVILQDVTLEIPRGRVTVLVGGSGAGKTSLLRLLNRLDEPSDGEIRFRRRPLSDYPVTRLRRRVGFVFQTPVMFPGTVRDNLRVAAQIAGISDPEFSVTARKALEHAELDLTFLDRAGGELSIGEKQRVNLARTLMTRPEVLVLDEPTSALDPETSEVLLHTLRRLCREEALTVVFSSHRVREAGRVGDHAIVLEAGHIVKSGSARDVLSDQPNPGS